MCCGHTIKGLAPDSNWWKLTFSGYHFRLRKKKIEMKLTKVTFFTETALSAQEKSGGFYNEKGH